MREYFDVWASRGVRAWGKAWWTLSVDVGDEVAPLIGAGPGEVVFLPSVTLAHAVIPSALRVEGGVNVVTDEAHFSSILYLLEESGARW